MEYGLRLSVKVGQIMQASLNPCCNGIWSQTTKVTLSKEAMEVLILVVMEYGLRQS